MRNCAVLPPKGWNETIQNLEKEEIKEFPEGFLNFWVDLQIIWVNIDVSLFWQRPCPAESTAWPQLYFAACFSHQSGYLAFPSCSSTDVCLLENFGVFTAVLSMSFEKLLMLPGWNGQKIWGFDFYHLEFSWWFQSVGHQTPQRWGDLRIWDRERTLGLTPQGKTNK